MKFKLGDRVRITVEGLEGYYIICFDKEFLERHNIDRGRLLWNDDELELLEDIKEENATNTYHGDEIIKMIREGSLKENDKLIAYINGEEETTFIIKTDSNGRFYIKEVDSEYDDVDSWDLINMTFSIKEKEYLTFTEAIKSGKKFKHKDWNTIYMTTKEIFNFIIHSGFKESLIEQLDKRVWELE